MNVISQVSILFILIVAGFCSAKFKVTNQQMAENFSAFILKITMPCMIIAAFQRPLSRELVGEMFVTLAGASLSFGMSLAIAAVYPFIARLKGKERGIHRYALISPNSGFIGYPMVEAIFGASFLFHTAIYNIPCYLASFSLGIWFIVKESGKGTKFSLKNIINPCIVSTLIGILFFVFSVRLPTPLYRGLKMTGDATTPLAMIVIGITLSEINFKQLFGRPQLYLTALFRLIVLPVLTALVCYFIGIRGPILTILVTLTAMPAGSTTSILASVYRVAPEEGGALVFITTLLCMITVPLIVYGIQAVA